MPGKVIDPNQNQRERNYGVVFVYDEYYSQDLHEGYYIYRKGIRNGTRGLLAGDIIGVLRTNENLTQREAADTAIYPCEGVVRFNGILTTQQNAPVIRSLRQNIGDVDEVEDMIEELIRAGNLITDF